MQKNEITKNPPIRIAPLVDVAVAIYSKKSKNQVKIHKSFISIYYNAYHYSNSI
ncbi:MAG: hypothetical protein LBO09_04890 [Candidatus Peribacteria bacterium]|nr:hypothetical protein [Candidatus Peribacteria bacterium]